MGPTASRQVGAVPPSTDGPVSARDAVANCKHAHRAIAPVPMRLAAVVMA
jgi:hypothetical protein